MRRWVGLDVARGLLVLGAAVLGVAAWLGPDAVAARTWVGLGLLDLVPGAFLVLAGLTAGWRAEAGARWPASRRRRRAIVLLVSGAIVALARANPDPSLLGPDELVRLAVATGVAAWLATRHLAVPVLVAPLLLLGAAVAVTGHPAGRGLRGLDPSAAYGLERALGLSETGVPLVSFLPAVGLVLIGHAVGRWMHRRPPGPASGAALLTVALWCGMGVLVTAQVVAPVPLLLTLPAAFAATGVALAMAGIGHLVAVAGPHAAPVAAIAATGRVALVPVTLGAAAFALLPATGGPSLPTGTAFTAGLLVAVTVALAARHLDRRPLRA